MASLQQIFKQLKEEKKRAVKEVERREEAIASFGKLLGKKQVGTRRRRLSAAGRRRIAAAQKARWAKLRAK